MLNLNYYQIKSCFRGEGKEHIMNILSEDDNYYYVEQSEDYYKIGKHKQFNIPKQLIGKTYKIVEKEI